jgi:hypothetical protein
MEKTQLIQQQEGSTGSRRAAGARTWFVYVRAPLVAVRVLETIANRSGWTGTTCYARAAPPPPAAPAASAPRPPPPPPPPRSPTTPPRVNAAHPSPDGGEAAGDTPPTPPRAPCGGQPEVATPTSTAPTPPVRRTPHPVPDGAPAGAFAVVSSPSPRCGEVGRWEWRPSLAWFSATGRLTDRAKLAAARACMRACVRSRWPPPS